MHRIFISYSRHDESFARKLAQAISEIGADVWIDIEDIPAGMKWSKAIQEGLDTADTMLIILSPTSMSSANVEDEWQYFMDKRKPIIPILWQPTNVHFQLNRLQYIDFHNQSFPHAFDDLLTELERKNIPLAAPAAKAEPVLDDALRGGSRLNSDTRLQQQQAQTANEPSLDINTKLKLPLSPVLQRGLIALSLLTFVIIVFGLVWQSNQKKDEAIDFSETGQQAAAQFATPLPVLRYDGAAFPMHHEAIGGSELYVTEVRRAEIPYRQYQAADETIWYRVHDLEHNQDGWQVVNNLYDLEYHDSLVVPLLLDTYVQNPQDVVMFQTPSSNDAAYTFRIDTPLYVYGFTIHDTGQVWYKAEFTNGANQAVGWFKDPENTEPSPYLALISQTISPNPSLFQRQLDDDGSEFSFSHSLSLSGGKPIHILDVDNSTETFYVYMGIVLDGAWQFGWIKADDTNLNAPSRAYLLNHANTSPES